MCISLSFFSSSNSRLISSFKIFLLQLFVCGFNSTLLRNVLFHKFYFSIFFNNNPFQLHLNYFLKIFFFKKVLKTGKLKKFPSTFAQFVVYFFSFLLQRIYWFCVFFIASVLCLK